MRNFCTIVTAALIALCTASCINIGNTAIVYGYNTYATVEKDLTLTDDEGNILHPSEESQLDGKEGKRLYIVCNVMDKVEGTDNEYNIEIQYGYEVTSKEPVMSGSADEETLGNDPVLVSGFAASAGYINMEARLEYVKDSGVKHSLDLVVDETKTDADTLWLEIRHDANGESVLSDPPAKSPTTGLALASFPIHKIVKEGQVIAIRYNWFKVGTEGEVVSSKVCSKDKYVTPAYIHPECK